MERDYIYESNNIAYDWQYTQEAGGGIKCKNFELCESVLPMWWFECKGNYLCSNCEMNFGTWGDTHVGKGILETKDQIECPLCFECKKGISQPRCEHFVCIDCFKRCHYGDNDRRGEPIFPYPEIAEEYDGEYDEIITETKYPLIRPYHEEWNNWNDVLQLKYESEEYLRVCPICRK